MADATAPRLRRDHGPRPGTAAAPTRPPGFLASPLGMLVAIPLLVAISAGLVLGISQAVMRRHAEAQAVTTFQVQARAVRARVTEVLGQAAPLMGQVAPPFQRSGLTPGQPAEALASWLVDGLRGRPGVAQILVADGEGRFLAAGHDGTQGYIVTAEPRTTGSLRTTWNVVDGRLSLRQEEPDSLFDPRQRPWYRAAMAAGGPVWSDAYLFARTGRTGITCAEALPGPGGSRIVVGVDFDLDSLGSALAPIDGQAVEPVLFTADRAVLAAPPEWLRAPDLGVTRVSDLLPDGPRLMLAGLGQLPGDGAAPARIPAGPDHGWGGSVTAIPVPGGPTWYLATLVADEVIYGPSRAAMQSSLVAGLAAVAAGSLAAVFFAGHLARSRRETAAQRDRARKAEAAIDDLGSYRLVKLLGRGGMGEVWLAEHRLLARQAAIKRIIPKSGDFNSEEGRQRFIQEARTTASLRCRNTIELYDYGITDDGSLYFAMELLDGCDLRDLVRKSGPLPVGRVVHLMVQACRSLAEAHARGLVHRDIKPENLYACRRADEVDILKVLDFGIATVSRREPGAPGLTQAGYVQGTPATMAPEQACAEVLDGRADIYALGCVMYILLTGDDPFRGTDAYEIIAAHLREEPVPPSQRADRALPAELDALVLGCMAKERTGRPADAAVLAEALLAIPVPDDQLWSGSRARAWWMQHLPPGETTPAALPAAGPA